MTENATPNPAPDVTPEAVRAFLKFCVENPSDPDALAMLAELREELLKPEFSEPGVQAVAAVAQPLFEAQPTPPALHAHMTVLLSALLQIESQRPEVDKLFTAWMRNPSSYGPGHLTPPALQRPEFVQRLADLLGWGDLEVTRDHDALQRFLFWINSWTLKNKYRVRRTLNQIQRNFPSPDLWAIVRLT